MRRHFSCYRWPLLPCHPGGDGSIPYGNDTLSTSEDESRRTTLCATPSSLVSVSAAHALITTSPLTLAARSRSGRSEENIYVRTSTSISSITLYMRACLTRDCTEFHHFLSHRSPFPPYLAYLIASNDTSRRTLAFWFGSVCSRSYSP